MCPQLQACSSYSIDHVLPLTPNICVFRTEFLSAYTGLPLLLRCAPLLCVEVQTLSCSMWGSYAAAALQIFRSLPQGISWQPLEFVIQTAQAHSTVLEVCAALGGTPLGRAVLKIKLERWDIEPPFSALCASFPNVLHFELYCCPQSMAFLDVAISVWPTLRSITCIFDHPQGAAAAQQHLEAVARAAAELKAGQPIEVVLRVSVPSVGDNAARLDALVAAIRSAGGGEVIVTWRFDLVF